MAELTQGRVDIISRENGTLISQSVGSSSQTINLTEPSVVRISGTRDMVTQYERQGNDLVLQMRDGQTVRYQKFFLDDAEGQHSELVFDDGVNPPEHALFPQTAEGAELASSAVTPTYESLDSVEPLLLADNANTSMSVITAGGLGVLGLAGLAVGIGGGGGGGGGNGGGNAGGTDPGTPVTPGTPAITLNAFAGDNVLDNAEKTTDQVLSGTTSNVEAGQIVTVTLGGQSYSGSVTGDGSWSITVPADALIALASGTTTATATVTNQAGTAASGNLTFNVEPPLTEPGTPVITINQFAGDDVLSNAEKSSDQLLSGSTSNVEPGQVVTITLGDQTISAVVDAQGNWSVTLSPAALNALNAGSLAISAVVTNQAGIEASENRAISVDTPAIPGPPAVTVDAFTGDNQLSNAEKTTDQTVTGSTSNIEPGQVVTVTLGGQTYSGSVDAQGNWSVTLPLAALSVLASGETTLTVSVS